MKILKDILYGARISEVIGSTHIAVESVVADSRQVKPFGCFVAIAGTAVDGHDHIAGAIRAGAAAVVCERLPAPEDRTDQVVYIQVDNARSALGHLAANFHDNPTERLKVVAITGCTTGTGFVCAQTLAKKGARVVLLNRPSPRAEEAERRIKEAAPRAVVETITCDNASLASVRGAAKKLKDKFQGKGGIDVLCLNAGVCVRRS